MIFTIDPYYDIAFLNRTLETLKNNRVPYELLIDSKQPYNFYIESPMSPVFLDFDEVPDSRKRFLVSTTKAYTPSNDYIYMPRQNNTGLKGFKHYQQNDVFKAMQKSGEGIILNLSMQQAQEISKEYPRDLYFLGRYLGNTHRLFQADSLLLKNYLDSKHTILVQSSSFTFSTELESYVNYNRFQLKDRILKLDVTPKFRNGKFIQPPIRNEYRSKFLLS